MDVLRLKKAHESVLGWKRFSCQNRTAGDIFGINLFLRLSLILSVAWRNGSDAVQLCPVLCVNLFTVVRPCQPVQGPVSSLSIRLQQSMYSSLSTPAPIALPGTNDQLQRMNAQARLLGRSAAQWWNTCLARQGPWDPDYL